MKMERATQACEPRAYDDYIHCIPLLAHGCSSISLLRDTQVVARLSPDDPAWRRRKGAVLIQNQVDDFPVKDLATIPIMVKTLLCVYNVL